MENFEERVKAAFDEIAADQTPKYAFQPIPCELDSKIDRLISLFRHAPVNERQYFFEFAGEKFSWLLIVFAERMATLAVRKQSRDKVLEGLLALILEDYRVDPRDNLTRLAVLYDAATRIGVSPDEIFSEAARFANNSVAQSITEFPSRRPADRSLKAFFYKAVDGPNGFTYEESYPWQLG